MAAGDREPRRLLESGAGEQHPRGEVAELRVGARAQPRLGDDGRNEVGGVAVLAQAGDHPCDVVGGVDRTGTCVEEPEPFGREKRGELVQIHPVSL